MDAPIEPTRVRVLVVEDDATLAELFAQILRDRGHDVQLARDVPAAVAALERSPDIDVVVADLRLPGASGLELLSYRNTNRTATRVVVASAFAAAELGYHARRLGADEILCKPVEPEALVSAVER